LEKRIGFKKDLKGEIREMQSVYNKKKIDVRGIDLLHI